MKNTEEFPSSPNLGTLSTSSPSQPHSPSLGSRWQSDASPPSLQGSGTTDRLASSSGYSGSSFPVSPKHMEAAAPGSHGASRATQSRSLATTPNRPQPVSSFQRQEPPQPTAAPTLASQPGALFPLQVRYRLLLSVHVQYFHHPPLFLLAARKIASILTQVGSSILKAPPSQITW